MFGGRLKFLQFSVEFSNKFYIVLMSLIQNLPTIYPHHTLLIKIHGIPKRKDKFPNDSDLFVAVIVNLELFSKPKDYAAICFVRSDILGNVFS